MVMNRLKGNIQKKKEEKRATKQRLPKLLIQISKKCNYNSSKFFGMDMSVSELKVMPK